jgi:hypothetical protein
MTCKYCGDHNEECLCDIECDNDYIDYLINKQIEEKEKNNDNKRYNCM